jgi:hypothetical protein
MRKLEYEVSQEDFIAFNLDYWRTTASAQSRFRRSRLLLAALYVILAAAMYLGFRGLAGAVSGGFMLAFGALQSFLARRAAERRIAKACRSMTAGKDAHRVLGKKGLMVEGGNLVTEEEGGSGVFALSGIERIGESEACLFLYRDAISAFIIPKSAFSGPEEMAEFRSLIEGAKAAATT